MTVQTLLVAVCSVAGVSGLIIGSLISQVLKLRAANKKLRDENAELIRIAKHNDRIVFGIEASAGC